MNFPTPSPVCAVPQIGRSAETDCHNRRSCGRCQSYPLTEAQYSYSFDILLKPEQCSPFPALIQCPTLQYHTDTDTPRL